MIKIQPSYSFSSNRRLLMLCVAFSLFSVTFRSPLGMPLDAKATEWLNGSTHLSAEDKPMFASLFDKNGINSLSDIKLLSRDDLIEMKVAIGKLSYCIVSSVHAGYLCVACYRCRST
jgi:hypothetical protein